MWVSRDNSDCFWGDELPACRSRRAVCGPCTPGSGGPPPSSAHHRWLLGVWLAQALRPRLVPSGSHVTSGNLERLLRRRITWGTPADPKLQPFGPDFISQDGAPLSPAGTAEGTRPAASVLCPEHPAVPAVGGSRPAKSPSKPLPMASRVPTSHVTISLAGAFLGSLGPPAGRFPLFTGP